MTAPIIIGAGSNTNGFAANTHGNSVTRVFSNISIPANANTVFIHVGFDSALGTRNIANVTYTGLSGHIELLNVDPSPTKNVKITRFIAIDVSNCDAATIEVTMTLSTASSSKGICGVVCTEGFIQNVTLTCDRLLETHKLMVHQGNQENTTLLSMGIMDEDQSVLAFSGTGVTELYKVDETTINCFASSQSTTVNGFKTIDISSDNNADDVAHAIILLSSQSDPFDGITGKLTSPIIK